MSQLASHEIETIVRMVVDRLRDSGTASVDKPNVEKSHAVAPQLQSNSSSEPGTLVIPARLVTLEDIEGKLTGIQTVSLLSRSLLTPAVKDELRRRKIKIVRGNGSPNSSAGQIQPKQLCSFQVIAAEEKFRIVKSVAKQFVVGSLPPGLATLDVVQQLTNSAINHRSIWCAARPHSALLACSQSSAAVRVACLYQAADLDQAVLEVQPTILVLDDARWSGYQVGRLIQAWSRIGDQGGLK